MSFTPRRVFVLQITQIGMQATVTYLLLMDLGEHALSRVILNPKALYHILFIIVAPQMSDVKAASKQLHYDESTRVRSTKVMATTY